MLNKLHEKVDTFLRANSIRDKVHSPLAALALGICDRDGNPVFNALDGTTAGMNVKQISFTENGINTVFTGSVTIPAGAWLHDIQITNTALWTAATSATMKVGDAADDDGYFTGINLKATDLVLGEVLSAFQGSIDTDGMWGGKNGAYLVAATGRRGPTSSNFGMYMAAGCVITGVVTVDGLATAGRTQMNVIYSYAPKLAATASS